MLISRSSGTPTPSITVAVPAASLTRVCPQMFSVASPAGAVKHSAASDAPASGLPSVFTILTGVDRVAASWMVAGGDGTGMVSVKLMKLMPASLTMPKSDTRYVSGIRLN